MKSPEHISSGRVHAYVALAVLLIAAAGWNVLLYGKYFAKKPVPVPKHVEVQDHRLYNFPKLFEDFELAPETERGNPPPEKRDGIREITEDELDVLGTLKHEWNWYYMATFRDVSVPRSKGRRYMQLDITYYTGLLEAIPHVPERCLAASGATVLSRDTVAISLPGLPEPSAEPWKNIGLPEPSVEPWKNIKIVRTAYEWPDKETGRIVRGAQYHFFSVNGAPEHAWTAVRMKTGALTLKYCYFAKIQLAPSGTGLDKPEVCDAFCQQFLRQVMPSILRSLPTAEDVEKLSTRKPAPEKPVKK